MNDLDTLVHAAEADFGAAPSAAELENAKARYLGKGGRVTEMLKALAQLSPDEKKARGAEINQAKTRIEAVDESAKYSWVKSPRWKGHAMEVGPLARYVIGYVKGIPEFKEPTDMVLQKLGGVPVTAPAWRLNSKRSVWREGMRSQGGSSGGRHCGKNDGSSGSSRGRGE